MRPLWPYATAAAPWHVSRSMQSLARFSVLAAFALLATGSACESKICGPGDQRTCACATGSGTQTCNLNGTEWGKCDCAPPKAAAAAPSEPPERAHLSVVKAEDLGPADPKVNPDSKIVRITFDVHGTLRGDPTVTDSKHRKITARPEAAIDPSAAHQARLFIVPNDAGELRIGVGPDDPGEPVGEIKTVEAAERFKQRQFREHH